MHLFTCSPDQRGQIQVLFLISLMSLVFTVALVFNTGQQVHMRTKVQNAVDSAAISHAANVARSLNMMSMNNVAITQAFTLEVLMSSLLPELTAASFETGKVIAKNARQAAIHCAAWSWVLCAVHVAYVIEGFLILNKLLDIWADLGVSGNVFSSEGVFADPPFPPEKIERAFLIVQALESMNQQLVESFPDVSAQMSEKLATLNDLDEAPIYIGDGAFGPIADVTNYHGSTLPVVKTKPISGLFDWSDFNLSAAAQDYSLCLSGTYGSPDDDFKAFWNFQEHGYEIEEGPYKIGKQAFEAQIGPLVKRIERVLYPLNTDVADWTDFDDKIVDPAWALSCATQTMATIGEWGDTIDLYRVRKPYLIAGFGSVAGSADDWSILALARKQQPAGFIAKHIFRLPTKAHYAYAQAEVFNPVWYDLYTQDWQVKLVPAEDLNDISSEAIKAIEQYFPTLAAALEMPIATEINSYNTH